MKYVRSFVNWWKQTYNKQRKTGKAVFLGVSFLLFCCLCSIPISLLSPSDPPQVDESAIQTAVVGTLVGSDNLTLTAIAPTSSQTPLVTDTPTITFSPTNTITPIPPSATALPTDTPFILPTATSGPSANSVVIVSVNKSAEYVDIKNVSSEPINLSGWVLVSERGNQSCGLGGVIQPSEVLRIWAMSGDPGYSCGYSTNIWNNSESDPAVLYNPQGQEVSRY